MIYFKQLFIYLIILVFGCWYRAGHFAKPLAYTGAILRVELLVPPQVAGAAGQRGDWLLSVVLSESQNLKHTPCFSSSNHWCRVGVKIRNSWMLVASRCRLRSSWADWKKITKQWRMDSASESHKPDVYVSKFGAPKWMVYIICLILYDDFQSFALLKMTCWCPNMGMICPNLFNRTDFIIPGMPYMHLWAKLLQTCKRNIFQKFFHVPSPKISVAEGVPMN